MLSNFVAEEDSWESLDSKEIKLVSHKGNQPWILIERIDAEAEAPILWPPDAKNQLIGKDSDAGKDWRQKKKVTGDWDGWTASLRQCTWTWANSRRSWGTGRPDLLHPWGHEVSETVQQKHTTIKSLYLFAYIATKAIFLQSILYILWTVACQALLSIEFSR